MRILISHGCMRRWFFRDCMQGWLGLEAIDLQRLPTSRGCIICGTENPIGLRLRFMSGPEGVETAVRPPVAFQGFDGVLQGGIVAGLMDDAMWYAIYGATGTMTMTAELTIRYRAPVPVETDLRVTASISEQRRSLFQCKASILTRDGEVLAEASGKFLPAPSEMVAQLKESLT